MRDRSEAPHPPGGTATRRTARVVLPLVVTTLLVPAGLAGQDPCPGASSVLAEAGWTAYQAGDMAEARRAFEDAIARCANDQYARTGRGYVALRAGDTAEASELFAVVVRAEPNNVDALVGLGLASWRAGDLDGVRGRFERVLALAPDHPTAIDYLERLDGARAGASASPADAAGRAWAEGDTEGALALYSERLDADPTDGLALLRVGLIHAWEGRYEAALELLDLLVELEPSNFDGRLARARVHAWSGDTSRARSEALAVLEVQPDNADALATLALFQSWSGDLEEALAGYDELLTIAPEHREGRRLRAQTLAWAADEAEALTSFRALVEADPTDVEARLGYARALAFSGHYGESDEQYRLVLEGAPGNMRAHVGRAKALIWAGRLVESERAALRAIELDRASGPAWAALGEAYRAQRRDGEALEAFEAAERFAPTDPGIRDQLQSLRRSFAPFARTSVTGARDSDENRMLTTTAVAGLHSSAYLELRARLYQRVLEQTFAVGRLERTAFGGLVEAEYDVRPGWRLTAGVGASLSDGADDPTFLSLSAGIRSPERYPVVASLTFGSSGFDETAALAERGVRASELLLTTRWHPAPRWRVDAAMSQGRYDGTESNGRRAGHLGASRLVGRHFSVGAAVRGFTFEKNLSDGYFDPDFYGVAEATAWWQHRPLPWSFLLEVAPGVEKVRSDGPVSGSVRGSGRVGYRIGAGRELALQVTSSTAGLNSSATGFDGYRYTAIGLSVNWIF